MNLFYFFHFLILQFYLLVLCACKCICVLCYFFHCCFPVFVVVVFLCVHICIITTCCCTLMWINYTYNIPQSNNTRNTFPVSTSVKPLPCGVREVNSVSKWKASSTQLTTGLNGGTTRRLYSQSQLIVAKNVWVLTSLTPPAPAPHRTWNTDFAITMPIITNSS